jgi:hypothetical protein
MVSIPGLYWLFLFLTMFAAETQRIVAAGGYVEYGRVNGEFVMKGCSRAYHPSCSRQLGPFARNWGL